MTCCYWHKFGPWGQRKRYTGQITLRLSDGMLMATTWADIQRVCSGCGQVEVLEGGFSSGSVPTGTMIDMSQLPPLPEVP